MGRYPRREVPPSQFIDPRPVTKPDTVKATVREVVIAKVVSGKDAANARRAAKAAGTWTRR